MNRRSRQRVVALFLAVLLVVTLLGGALAGLGGDDGSSLDTGTTFDTLAEVPEATLAPGDTLPPVITLPRVSDLPTVALAELPVEGQRTLLLIEQGGPFPYDRDGTTFQNREGLLPDQPVGYYREYTVPTPGSDDRGARRIVSGEQGEHFYTEDHYESFREITLD